MMLITMLIIKIKKRKDFGVERDGKANFAPYREEGSQTWFP